MNHYSNKGNRKNQDWYKLQRQQPYSQQEQHASAVGLIKDKDGHRSQEDKEQSD